jgi:hypothetical protein
MQPLFFSSSEFKLGMYFDIQISWSGYFWNLWTLFVQMHLFPTKIIREDLGYVFGLWPKCALPFF